MGITEIESQRIPTEDPGTYGMAIKSNPFSLSVFVHCNRFFANYTTMIDVGSGGYRT